METISDSEILQKYGSLIKEDHFNGVAVNIIAKKIGRTIDQINRVKIMLGLPIRSVRNRGKSKHELDYKIFDSIDSHDKAYWLGFLMADGCTNNKYKLTLVSKDIEVPTKFQHFLKTTIPVSRRDTFDKRTQKTYTAYTIQVNSKYIVESVGKYDINKTKSWDAKFPDIEEKYYCSYIRGLFDGDGSIFPRTNECFAVSIVGTKPIIEFMKNYFIEKYLFSDVKLSVKCLNEKSKQYELRINRIEDLLIFYRFIYSESQEGNRLNRKYNLFDELINRRENRPIKIKKRTGARKNRELPYAIYSYRPDAYIVSVPIKDKKIKHLGTYKSIPEAKIVRDKFLKKINRNIPD